ncbi:hypothetical protein DMB42_44645 [Nonomuraea sp. WAC 01424]|nr:hypothetical protein DMB42_44645 [Nonomuraea sp. WAC 01424]
MTARRPTSRRSGTLLAFAAGSLACALAPSMPVLIAARAVQGVGGGGLVVTAISALAQMFTREELVRRQGHLTGVFALSSPARPRLGGLLAAGPGWRWIFLVNLPLCAAAAPCRCGGCPAGHRTVAPARSTRGAPSSSPSSVAVWSRSVPFSRWPATRGAPRSCSPSWPSARCSSSGPNVARPSR